MTDEFDKLFKEAVEKDEKAKKLHQESEEAWKRASELSKERPKLLKKIPFPLKEKIEELRKKLAEELNGINMAIRSLNEQKEVHRRSAREKIKNLHKQRRVLIKNDIGLRSNKLEEEKAWEESRKKWKDYNNYYNELRTKIQKENNVE